MRIKQYYGMTKPGIIYGNLYMAFAGFFLASIHFQRFNIFIFLAVIFGTSLIIASACVFNNYMDRSIDAKMERTKKRALVTQSIPALNALLFGAVLGMVGLIILIVGTNVLTTILGVIAFVFYVFIYGYVKRVSVHGTLVGAIPGALPPVAGYTALANQIDTAAILLFVLLVAWQMPHFYAIAIRRVKDYANANIPVHPAVKGVSATKRQIIAYLCLYIVTVPLLTVFGYTGISYLVLSMLLAAAWLYSALKTFKQNDDTKWAKSVFLFSLLILPIMAILIPVGALLS